jgi:hypothetical protein
MDVLEKERIKSEIDDQLSSLNADQRCVFWQAIRELAYKNNETLTYKE